MIACITIRTFISLEKLVTPGHIKESWENKQVKLIFNIMTIRTGNSFFKKKSERMDFVNYYLSIITWIDIGLV